MYNRYYILWSKDDTMKKTYSLAFIFEALIESRTRTVAF
ncbi:hypothetical protein N507_0525 [Lacticaseibacillus rhamnosus DSM 14870]|nr:hypothetical protein N507_0525 [Lacticaseibacillus rhamnosus DSM 14870]